MNPNPISDRSIATLPAMPAPVPVTNDFRAPPVKVEEGEQLFFDEPGRVYYNADLSCDVDMGSFYFRVIRREFGGVILRCKSGLGVTEIRLGINDRVIVALSSMDSHSRFIMLMEMRDLHNRAVEVTTNTVETTWQRAAAEGRIKTRKVRGENKVRVTMLA